ncbi:MAG TPA: EAL domain-containing protein [Hyphomicrobiales bacterium]|nr:EAL domain-containing protein [Hyphomicrobiales bacterium]
MGNAFPYTTGVALQGARHEAGSIFSDERLQQMLDLTAACYWEQDAGCRFTYVHLCSALALRQTPEQFIGLCFWELEGMQPLPAPEWERFGECCRRGEPLRRLVTAYQEAGGGTRFFCIEGNAVRDAQGGLIGYRGIVRDVTGERRLEEQASTFDLSPVGIAHVSQQGRFLHVNAKFCELLGYEPDELVGRQARDITHPDDAHLVDAPAQQMRRGEIASFKLEKRYLRKDGTVLWVSLTSTLKRDPYDSPLYNITLVEDISGRREAEEQAHFLATHDALTQLTNRPLFNQLLAFAAASGRRHQRRFALIVLGLDRFKQVNEAYGSTVGDEVLKETGRRLSRFVRASDVVARLGGDEFAVLLEEAGSPDNVLGLARNLMQALAQPMQIRGKECQVTASLGISQFPQDGPDEQALLKKAALALFNVKEEGGNAAQCYHAGSQGQGARQLAMELGLRRAIEAREFSLHYQPKIRLATRQVCGVEALLRWQSPELGLVPPADFIQVAEDSGLIIPLGRWALEQACIQLRRWREAGLPSFTVAVNLSPRQFADPALIGTIEGLLHGSGLDPTLLQLEITESTVMHNALRAQQQLRAISQLGIGIAIDDFGTGHSSLAKLKTFPLDTLKIDKSFIRDIETDEEDRVLTETIIRMGKSLGLEVVAEGVETAGQLQLLAAQGCDVVQGYYFSKPLPAAALVDYLRRCGGYAA